MSSSSSSPLVNACRPPGEWQTYDLIFRAPKLAEDGRTIVPGALSVLHNGVLIQDHVPVTGTTTAAAFSAPSPTGRGPLMLQDHGNPVRFRHVWVRPL